MEDIQPVVGIVAAFSIVIAFLAIAWYIAWKLALSEVPILREIFGLPKRPPLPKAKTKPKRAVRKFD